MSKPHYAVEIFSLPSDAWYAATVSGIGLVGGVFRFVTDRPAYDLSTVIPTYGPDEIDVNGTSVAGANVPYQFFEGIFLKDGISGNPTRGPIDISQAGSYLTDAGFTFQIRGDQFCPGALAFWAWCEANNVAFTGRSVVFWAVIDDVFYQMGRGKINNNPIEEESYEFDVDDDATTLHKNMPSLVANPTNLPSSPQSGQAFPIVFGEVLHSKILKLTSTNIFINLFTANHSPATSETYQLAAATRYEVTGPIGPWKIHLFTSFYFPTNQLSNFYLQMASGGDSQSINKDTIYEILANTASTPDSRFGVGTGYITIINLAAPLLSDETNLFCATGYAAGGTGTQYSLNATSSGAATVFYKISSYKINISVSQNPVLEIKRDILGNPLLSTWDNNLKQYDSEAEIAKIGSDRKSLSLISNSASTDGSAQVASPINLALLDFGWTLGNLGDAPTEFTSAPADILSVTDKDRTTGKTFAGQFVQDLALQHTNAGFIFADYQVQNLPATLPTNLYFCIDFDVQNRNSNLAFFINGVTWFVKDVFGNVCATDSSIVAGTIPADAYANPNPNNGHCNFVPNDLLLNIGADATNILGNQSRPSSSSGTTMKTIVKVPSSIFTAYPQAYEVQFCLGLETYNLTVIPSPCLNFFVKEIMLVAYNKEDTITGDLFTSVVGETTGAATTDPTQPTNDVYHALMHIMEDLDLINKKLIDYGDLASTRGAGTWHVGRTVTDRKNSVEYLTELCAQSFIGMFSGRTGKRTLRAWVSTTTYTPTTTGQSLVGFPIITVGSLSGLPIGASVQCAAIFGNTNWYLIIDVDPGLSQIKVNANAAYTVVGATINLEPVPVLATPVPTTGNGKTPLHDDTLIVRDSIDSFSKTDAANVYNSFNLQYNYDQGSGEYTRNFIVSMLDVFTNFPAAAAIVGSVAVVASGQTLANLIATSVSPSTGHTPLMEGDLFHITTNGDDTTGADLATAKGSATIAGDCWEVNPDGAAIAYQGLVTAAGGVPQWYQAFGGLIDTYTGLSSSSHDAAATIWNLCKNSYTLTQKIMQAQSDIGELPWFVDRSLFDSTATWGTGTLSSAFLLLTLCAIWTTQPKDIVPYVIPLNVNTYGTELLDCINFKDTIYTNGANKLGWVTGVEVDAPNDQLKITAMLIPAVITTTPVTPPTIVNVTFPALSNVSVVRSPAYTTPSASHVAWGAGQVNVGTLVYTTNNPPTGTDDYTIDAGSHIVLNPTKWYATILANTLGLLNVDTW